MFLLPALEAIALILGILGRKSFAGKFTVVLISIIFLVLGPFLWLRWMSQVHHDFGGMPSVVRLPQPAFGPVIERTVETDIHGKYAIDLDTGTLHTPPANLRNEQELNHWIRAVGADAVGVLGNGLSGRDMLLCTVQNVRWDEDRPAMDMLDWFSRTMPSSPGTEISAEMPGKGPLPVTYQFKTREGATGLLQIVGFSEDPPGVKIRYKLVQKERATGSASGPGGCSRPVPDKAAGPSQIVQVQTCLIYVDTDLRVSRTATTRHRLPSSVMDGPLCRCRRRIHGPKVSPGATRAWPFGQAAL